MREKLFSVTKKDLRIDTFRSGGKGGQHQNKKDTGVRITHPESGAVGESREHRSQLENRKVAFNRLLEHHKWKIWFNIKIAECLQKETIEQKVEKMLRDVTIEYKKDGKWVRIEEETLK